MINNSITCRVVTALLEVTFRNRLPKMKGKHDEYKCMEKNDADYHKVVKVINITSLHIAAFTCLTIPHNSVGLFARMAPTTKFVRQHSFNHELESVSELIGKEKALLGRHLSLFLFIHRSALQ